jgi:hypothetical protein
VEGRTHLKTRDLRQDCSKGFNELDSERKSSRRSADNNEKATQRELYNLLVDILKTFHVAILADINRMRDDLEKSSNRSSVVGDSANRTVGT